MNNPRKPFDTPLDPGVWILTIRHDDNCPTLKTQKVADCTCTEVKQELKRYTPEAN